MRLRLIEAIDLSGMTTGWVVLLSLIVMINEIVMTMILGIVGV